MSTSVLDCTMYTEAEAARLLGLRQSTLNYWLEGGVRRGRTYKPVVRVQARGGHPPVTWAEFIEAGFLREYRHERSVPLAELRAFVDVLREKFGVPYPLADRRPFVSGKEFVLQAQDVTGLDPDFCLVAPVRQQLRLLPAAQSFVERVDWDDNLVIGWRPHGDPASPVRINPLRRAGRPAVGGISTEVLWEQIEAGLDFHEVADSFGVAVDDVHWACAYETSRRAA